MKCLSIKESLAFVEILMGIMCIYNFFLTDFYDEKLFDIGLLKHRCISVSLAFISFYNALGIWFWFSNVKTTKMLNRLHKVLVYVVLDTLLVSSHFSYKTNYGPLAWGHFNQDIFFDEIARLQTSSFIVSIIVMLSLVLIAFNVNFIRFRAKILLKRKERNRV